MTWLKQLFTYAQRTSKLLYNPRIYTLIIGCLVFFCILGVLVHPDDPGPTLPWPWP